MSYQSGWLCMCFRVGMNELSSCVCECVRELHKDELTVMWYIGNVWNVIIYSYLFPDFFLNWCLYLTQSNTEHLEKLLECKETDRILEMFLSFLSWTMNLYCMWIFKIIRMDLKNYIFTSFFSQGYTSWLVSSSIL